MKQRLLLLERLKRAALLVLLLYAVGMSESLAQTQVATLQHGDSIRVFYGANALTAAYNAADTCDIITLSDGTFTGVNITKAITLRGAGCVWDSVSASFPTIVSGQVNMNIPSSDLSLSIEGIYFTNWTSYGTLNHPHFSKCNFERFYGANSSTSILDHAQFVNCMLKDVDFYNGNNTTMVNCVIWEFYLSSGTVDSFNSFIKLSNSNPNNLFAFNCVIDGSGFNYLTGNSVAFNCIGIKRLTNSVFASQNYGCMTVNSYADVFETFDGSEFSYLEKFLLREEIASSFLGTDGTEVGIYGGTAPYNPRPSHMVVKHCNVANKSTVDGKLSVEIEVYTEDE